MTSTSTTTTTTAKDILPPPNMDSSERSCSALDLSWLSESVMEAALNTQNLSIQDVNQFHESLKAAEEFGSMDHDTSERLHEKIQKKENTLLEKLVAHETARVSRKLGLYSVLKTHKTWEQVHYMADMHGQGAYILMKDFKGLKEADMKEALTPFHAYLDEKSKEDQRPIPLPFSKPEEAKYTKIDDTARPKVNPKVAEKLCKAYRRLYASMHDPDMGGYSQEFLTQEVFANNNNGNYTPQQLCDLLHVVLPDEDSKLAEQEDVDEDRYQDEEEVGEDDDEEDGAKKGAKNGGGRHVRSFEMDDDVEERY